MRGKDEQQSDVFSYISPGGKGGKVKSRMQAIAIGRSEARQKGAKVSSKKAA